MQYVFKSVSKWQSSSRCSIKILSPDTRCHSNAYWCVYWIICQSIADLKFRSGSVPVFLILACKFRACRCKRCVYAACSHRSFFLYGHVINCKSEYQIYAYAFLVRGLCNWKWKKEKKNDKSRGKKEKPKLKKAFQAALLKRQRPCAACTPPPWRFPSGFPYVFAASCQLIFQMTQVNCDGHSLCQRWKMPRLEKRGKEWNGHNVAKGQTQKPRRIH